MPLKFFAWKFSTMGTLLRIDSSACLWWAVLILVLPLSWLVAAFAAAFFHELCHVVTVILLGGRIFRIRIFTGGAMIDAHIPGFLPELISILAGPAGSFSLMLFCHSCPLLALCGFLQGCYNLLPLPGLDGSRALILLLERTDPETAGIILKVTEASSILLILFLLAAAVSRYGMHLSFAVFVCVFILKRKISCKEHGIRVQ